MRSAVLLSSAIMLVATTAGAKEAKPTEAQIFGILTAANNSEINAAKLAQTNATSDEVKTFANDMVKGHTALNEGGSSLATKLNITPEDSSWSKDLQTGGEKRLTKLQGLTGAEFDKAYVNDSVADHQTVLKTIDKKLLPAAQNTELKTMLKDARKTVAQHLDHAKHLQAMLKKSSKAPMGKTP